MRKVCSLNTNTLVFLLIATTVILLTFLEISKSLLAATAAFTSTASYKNVLEEARAMAVIQDLGMKTKGEKEKDLKPSFNADCYSTFLTEVSKSEKLSQTEKDVLSLFLGVVYSGSVNFTKLMAGNNPVLLSSAAEISKKITLGKCGKIRNTRMMEKNNNNTRLALVTVSDGASPNIQEWIAYHLLIGFTKIMIFDDSDQTSPISLNFQRAVQPFVDAGYVDLKPINNIIINDWGHKEILLHNEFLDAAKDTFDWVGFIGADEYLVIHRDVCMFEFLDDFNDFSGLVFQWRLFSPVGVPLHNMNLTHFEQYRHETDDSARHVKSLIRPNDVDIMLQHHANYKEGKFAVNSRKERVDGPFNLKMEEGVSPFELIETRHFSLGDLLYSIAEKTCGGGSQRKQYQHIRMRQIIIVFEEMERGSVKLLEEETLPFQEELSGVLFH